MRGGMRLGGLLTDVSIGWISVRHALLVNGSLAVVLQLLTASVWWRHTASAPTNPSPID